MHTFHDNENIHVLNKARSLLLTFPLASSSNTAQHDTDQKYSAGIGTAERFKDGTSKTVTSGSKGWSMKLFLEQL